MRRLTKVAVFALACAAAVLPVQLHAQVPTVTGELAFRSKYFFAGIPFAAEQVQQAKVTVGVGSLTFNGHGVYDFDAEDITEADLWGDYYVQAAPLVGLFFGAALYNFLYPDEWKSTPELYGGVVLSIPLTPTLYVAHDFDLGDGTHATLTLSHSVPLGTSGTTLDLAGNVDYNAEYYTPDSGLSFANLSAALTLPVGPISIGPMVLIQRRLDDVFQDWIPDDELFGVTASMTF